MIQVKHVIHLYRDKRGGHAGRQADTKTKIEGDSSQNCESHPLFSVYNRKKLLLVEVYRTVELVVCIKRRTICHCHHILGAKVKGLA